MKNQAILLITVIIFILAPISSAYTEATLNTSIKNDSNLNNNLNSTQTNNIYVNVNIGNDDWDGTSSTYQGDKVGPKKTIRNATGTVNNGGTINIANGNYSGINNTGIVLDKNMTIIGQNNSDTVIDGQKDEMIFYIPVGIVFKVQNLNIQNAKNNDGGAIFNSGTCYIENCTLSNNYALYDGGAMVNNGICYITNSNFINNTANNNEGGAILNGGNCNIVDCTFTGNTATYGGSIYNLNNCTFNINNTKFTANSAQYGSAIYNNGTGSIENCSLLTNMATHDGGAIYNDWSCSINNVNFINNTASYDGGAIYNDYYCYLTDTKFSGNKASNDGGAIHTNEFITSSNASFLNNTAQKNGGAIYNIGNCNFTNGNFTNNTAKEDNGGAIYTDFFCYLTNVNFSGNIAKDSGGAIYTSFSCYLSNVNFSGNYADQNGGAIYTDDDLNIEFGCFQSNNSTMGGSIYVNKGTLNSANCTFTGNYAGLNGGAINNYNSAKFIYCQFNQNKAGISGGAICTNKKTDCTATSCNFTYNSVSGDNTGGAIYCDYGDCNVTFNYFYGNIANEGEAIFNQHGARKKHINAENNWWGSNNPDFNKLVHGPDIDTSPYLVLSINANPTSIYNGQTSNIVANLIMNSKGENTLTKYAMHIPDGIPVAFATNLGNINPKSSVTSLGGSNTVFTANSASGTALINATVNDQTVNTTIHIIQSADVQITKTVNNTLPNVGDEVTFTVTAKNNGPDNATNVQIIDMMPKGFDNFSYTASDGTSYSSGVWTISNLANGTAATLTLSGTVNSSIAGKTTTNTANKTAEDQYDSNPNNNNASASIYVPVADIHVAKTVDKNNPQVGNKVAFTVTIINDGPDNATNIEISDRMPAGFSNVVITPSIGAYDNTTGIWTIPTITNGANATLILSGEVTSMIAGQQVTNTATKTAEDQYDPTPDDDTASASINTQEADVDITKTVDKNTANVGENVIFTINVTNKGPNNATGLKFLDKLPAGLQYTSNTVNKGIAATEENNVLWNLGSLNNGETATLTITATVLNHGNLTNIVRKIHEDQYDPDIDSANASIYAPEADVKITNTPNNSVLDVGDNATFTVKVRNNGPDTATGVVINDTIPQGFTANVTKGNIVNSMWTIGTLETDEEATLTITGVITSQWAGKVIYNNVSETQNEYSTETKTANANITVNKAGLYLISTSGNLNIKTGENAKITFKLGNIGPDTAKNVLVTIPIPSGFEFINSSVDQGTCSYNESSRTLTWNVGDVQVGDPYIYLNLKAVKDGHYIIIPTITTTTYDTNIEKAAIPISIDVAPDNGGDNNENKINVETIPLPKTGLAIIGLITAIIMVLGGLGSIRRR